MKNKLLIIESDIYNYFTTKQILEAQLRLKINIVASDSQEDLLIKAEKINPNSIMIHPSGGIAELLNNLKRRRVNRLNTEVTILIAQAEDIHHSSINKLKSFKKGTRKTAHAQVA